jgi:hypothetical protein
VPPIVTTGQLGPGWKAFADPAAYQHYGLILILATLSGAVLALHPVYRGRPATLDDLEQRKTLILYSVVGALIAVICALNPSMAFVIFGIGGLMRFRTELGGSKHTAATIVGTLVGLCWGLELQMVALLATVYFWLMIWLLERSRVLQLNVGGVAVADMGRATEAYRDALKQAGCSLASASKNFKKQQLGFVVRVPSRLQVDDVMKQIDAIPAPLRGTPDWPE